MDHRGDAGPSSSKNSFPPPRQQQKGDPGDEASGQGHAVWYPPNWTGGGVPLLLSFGQPNGVWILSSSFRCLVADEIATSPLNASQDLLHHFNVLPLYEKFVRPFLKPPKGAGATASAPPGATPTSPEASRDASGKGKGKAVDGLVEGGSTAPTGTDGAAPTHGANGSGSTGSLPSGEGSASGKTEGGPKRAKMEKSYGHLVSEIGGEFPSAMRRREITVTYVSSMPAAPWDASGRNSIKKDHFFRDLVLNPDAQPADVRQLDDQMLSEGFVLKPGQLPDVR